MLTGSQRCLSKWNHEASARPHQIFRSAVPHAFLLPAVGADQARSRNLSESARSNASEAGRMLDGCCSCLRPSRCHEGVSPAMNMPLASRNALLTETKWDPDCLCPACNGGCRRKDGSLAPRIRYLRRWDCCWRRLWLHETDASASATTLTYSLMLSLT